MYLIRRVFKVKPGTHRRAADLAAQIGKIYEDAGQRSPARVYWSGGTVPGPANTVYMDWTDDVIRSPYRSDNVLPDAMRPLAQELRELQEETSIEFYQILPE
jgi:hypothetical protein